MILWPSGCMIGIGGLAYISRLITTTNGGRRLFLRWVGDSEGGELQLDNDDAIAFDRYAYLNLLTDTAFVPEGEDDDTAA